ncbi:MAG TPA: LysR family transcriptional regulator [Polyangiaceae bacterium]|nr:LysR family transcriptional regulator [Polyangiaceae bacterium]HYQ25732.1 LysR family transcriptional regulator [Polyangiaceae bacterium]
MNLERIELFLKIVDTGSVSAAGREANLTQPAVSRSLKLLEEDIGADLFDRQGRGLLLTAAGRALIPCARQLLRESDRARMQVQRAAKDAYFDLRVGSVDSLGTHVLPNCLTRLQANHPELKLKLWMGRTQSLLERVDRGTLDLAFVAYSGPPSERSERVGSYGMKYYGRSDRFPELATLTSELELRRLPIVEIEALAGQPSLIHADADAFAVTQNLSAVKALVLAGLGVGQMLPFMLSEREREQVVCAEHISHDPDCGVFGVRSFRAFSEQESRIQEELLALIAAQLLCD